MKQSWLLFERCLFNFGRKKEAGWPKFPKKSPRITKNINGYTKRTSLQKENKTKKKKKKKQASQTPGLKRVHQKIVVSKFLAKAKEGERVQKDRGAGWKPRISGFFFYFLS